MQTTPLPRHQRPTRLPEFLFGAPYYPEHWNAEDRRLDAERMQAAGVNVVRMAEFAWDVLEPARNQFDFRLFDETIGVLQARGIKTILCTPTATPPRWLTMGKNDWMRVDAQGFRMDHGNRQHVCINNEEFRRESRRITRAMAEHYRDQKAVIGWQTDNELYCHISVCYCDTCQQKFRLWLTEKHGTIDKLNEAWGNHFWAQTYDNFEQIMLPREQRRPAPVNPAHLLDFWRFLSDSATSFQAEQVEILREAQPAWWVTHNGTFNNIDHWKFAEALDFYGVDVYPGFAGIQPGSHVWAALKNESCRCASGGYIIPEQSGGPGGQMDYMHPTCEPGQMRLWAYQGIANGADGILHFRWRSCRAGAEIYWNGILDHDNVPRRRYREFTREGQELQKIGAAILGTVKSVQIGILTSYENDKMFASQTNGFPTPGEQLNALFATATKAHLPVGLLQADDSFTGMKVIIMPSHLAENETLTKKLTAFVKAGGTLLVSGRSFTRNHDNQVLAVTAPASLSPLLGITREEEGRILDGMDCFRLVLADGAEIKGHGGYEILKCKEAKTVATWQVGETTRHPHAATGECGLSVNTCGKGRAYYLGSYISVESAPALLSLLLRDSGLAPLVQAGQEVEATLRKSDDRKLLFLLNHSLQPQPISAIPAGIDLLGDTPIAGGIELEPFGVRIIKLNQGDKR